MVHKEIRSLKILEACRVTSIATTHHDYRLCLRFQMAVGSRQRYYKVELDVCLNLFQDPNQRQNLSYDLYSNLCGRKADAAAVVDLVVSLR